jgi:hypothetical protein
MDATATIVTHLALPGRAQLIDLAFHSLKTSTDRADLLGDPEWEPRTQAVEFR